MRGNLEENLDGPKKCTQCHVVRTEQDYHRHKGFPTGRRATCKVCVQAETKRYYEANREKHNKVCRKWQVNNKEKVKGYTIAYRERRIEVAKRWVANNPLKKKAQRLVNDRLKAGKISKGSNCQLCGCDDKALDAHHGDYGKPLEVVWVCKKCHSWIHSKKRVHASIAA